MVRLFETYDGKKHCIVEGASAIDAMRFFKFGYEQDGTRVKDNPDGGFTAFVSDSPTTYSIEEV